MVEPLIIENDQYRLFWINGTPQDEWINFRVKSVNKIRGKIRRSRLGYSRVQKRLADCKSLQAFLDKNPDGLKMVFSMIEDAVNDGLI